MHYDAERALALLRRGTNLPGGTLRPGGALPRRSRQAGQQADLRAGRRRPGGQLDARQGGTWTGAVEQLDKLHFVPVYTRAEHEGEHDGDGALEALRQKGALAWPEPATPEELGRLLDDGKTGRATAGQEPRARQASLFTSPRRP